MYLFRYSEIIVYGFALGLVLRAAIEINNLQFYHQKKTVYRLRLMDQLKEGSSRAANVFYNPRLERLLVTAGRPLALSSVRYNLVRFGLLGGWLLYLNIRWFIEQGRYPVNVLFLILAASIVTQPRKGLPLYYFLVKFKDLRLRVKNKECFILYSMIQNEFYTDSERPLNMYATLNKLRPYFRAIDRALGKAIFLWKKNPAEALDAFAVEVGTEEAADLAQILKNVDLSSPEDARDLLDSRYDQFVTKRHEHYRRYRNNLGLIGYIAVFLPVFAVIYNAMVIFNLEKQELLKFIYQR